MLILFNFLVQPSSTSMNSFFYCGLSLSLFLAVYYVLNRQITKRQLVEADFQDLYNNAPCGYHSLDKDGNFIAINDTELSWLGYDRDEVIGKLKITDVLTPESAANFQENFAPSLEGGLVKDLEFQLICKDGTILAAIANATVIKDAGGNFIATRTILFDISKRKQTEAILRQANEELKITVEQRTAELKQTKEQLQQERLERERVEQVLRQSEERWHIAIGGSDVYEEFRLRKQAEEALYQSESALRSFFDSASMMMGIVELMDDDILHISDAVTTAKSFGLTAEGIKNQLASEMDVSSKYVREWIERYREAERTQSPVRFEYVHDTVQGQRCLSATVSPIVLSQSSRSRFTYVVEDVTDRKRTQNALQESQAQLQAILDNSPAIIYLTDSQNRFILINRRYENLFNIRKEGILGRNVYEIWPDEIADRLATNNRKVLECGTSIEVEEVAPLEDGLHTYISVKFPLRDANGIPYAVCGISTDITKRKQAEDERAKLIAILETTPDLIARQKQIEATLREAERRWHSLLENVRLVAVGRDKNGKLNYVNPYFLEVVGYTKAEAIGQDWFETFLPLYQRKRLQNNYLELLEQEFYTYNQNIILTKSGEERVIAWNNTLLQDCQGNAIGTLSIGEDITERQVIERMKEEFISVVSHELRTPLTSIHGALNLLSSGLVNFESDKGQRVMEIAVESAERLVRLVNDILDLERLESGKSSLSKQTCNAAELMLKASEMMQVMANRADITLSISPEALQLNVDADRIVQVLTNLLGNAIKFSLKGSTVWLTVELQAGGNNATVVEWANFTPSSPCSISPTILFKVKDQGRGIPHDKLESIFDRFHQVDASDSRKKGGTGLGLAICRSIVQQHGGQIWVDSTLCEGSTFYFTLPVLTVEDNDHDNQANLSD